MQWNFATILILFGVLFAGYGIGLLEMHLKRQKKIHQLEDALKAEQANAALAAAAPPPAASQPSDLRLWSDASGTPNLELDNAPVSAPASLTPEQRRRLITLLTQIRPWLEGGPVAPAAAAPVKIVEPPTTPVAKSIVAQVNDILQSHLPGTPLAAKLVRLGETPGGGVLVFVGTAKYDGIDAVPDPEVVAAIRAAIAEWEKKAG
ncbi:MAG: hypothetical protein FD146_197 [Anaerolineaceae bacterium]|nr:MAG: hypothetical protein FD146_197 [Anaerolineaceae bacterium]